MSDMIDMENRLAALEKAVAELQAKRALTAKDWIEQTSGTMAANPMFDEMVRLGREYRESHFEPEESTP